MQYSNCCKAISLCSDEAYSYHQCSQISKHNSGEAYSYHQCSQVSNTTLAQAATLTDPKWNTTQWTWSVNFQNTLTCIYLVNLKYQRWLSYINCTDCKMCYFYCRAALIFWRLTKHGHSALDKIQRAAQISWQRAISEFTQLTTKWCLQNFFPPVIADFSFNLTFSPL